MKEMTELRERLAEIHDLRSTQGMLSWDLETHMPPKGSKIRSLQLGTLAKLSHEAFTAPRIGALLKTLQEKNTFKKLSPIDQAIVREVGKDYERERKIPVSLVQEMTQTTAEAMNIWVEARQNKRFSQFAPILERIIQLNQQMAEAIGYQGSPYNALLDLYEPDLTTQQLDTLFPKLKQDLIPLVQAIAASKKRVETDFLHKTYNTDKQLDFSRKVLTDMGFDFEAGRLDLAPHPFSMGIGIEDVRLTTRVFKHDAFSALSSSMHEGGHGLYDQGLWLDLERTTLDSGTSLGIHESQSRMWENLVGRSKSFWKHYFPHFKKTFPKALEGVTLDKFYKAINRVQPSPIRVEADEVTYNLHIILRYEIERDLIEGKLKVKDIPKVWNQKMTEYIGYTPKDDAEGCLQDVHWCHGSFGYFPTYTLGNLYSVQFFNRAKQQTPDLEGKISKGKLLPLKNWLNQEIHRVGKLESAAEIVQRVTKEPLKADYFVAYLWAKYGELYGIQPPARKKQPALAR